MTKNQLMKKLKEGCTLKFTAYAERWPNTRAWNLFNPDGEMIRHHISRDWISQLLNKRKIVQKGRTYVWRSAT